MVGGIGAADLWGLVASCCDFAAVLDCSGLNVLLCMTGLFCC